MDDFGKKTGRFLMVAIFVATFVEMLFFPTLPNLCGCVLAIFVCHIYTRFFLKYDIIIKYPFVSAAFLSVFMYRYLPVFVTLFDGHPITYGFEHPYQTFFTEAGFFVVASFAFKSSMSVSKRNGILQKMWNRFGFYSNQSTFVLWSLGTIGLSARLYTMSLGFGSIEMGDSLNKLLQGLAYLQYVPLCMFFPKLFGMRTPSRTSKIILIAYIIALIIVGIASNGRKNMIYTFVSIGTLFVLNFIHSGRKLSQVFRPLHLVVICVGFYFIMGFFSNMSQSQLQTRSIRSKTTISEQLDATMNAFSERNETKDRSVNSRDEELHNYRSGWTEHYVSNDFFGRYCNMRISDELIYYYNRSGSTLQPALWADFGNRIISLLPTPVLRFLGSNYDKTQGLYSRGDLVYSMSTGRDGYGGYRVTAHVGDGLLTFGWWYWPIQFLILFTLFNFLVSFAYFTNNGVRYSILGTVTIFDFLNIIVNANGCSKDLQYMLRTYWQNIILFLIVLAICRFVSRLLGSVLQR